MITIKPAVRLRNTELAAVRTDEHGFRQAIETDPSRRAISQLDAVEKENYLTICKIARLWKFAHKVPLTGLLLDTLCLHFIIRSPLRKKSEKYQDCLLRDFFNYLADQEPKQTWWTIPDSTELIERSGSFEPFAATAYSIAQYAIDQAVGKEDKASISAWRYLLGDYRLPA